MFEQASTAQPTLFAQICEERRRGFEEAFCKEILELRAQVFRLLRWRSICQCLFRDMTVSSLGKQSAQGKTISRTTI
jgi:hypothetical protein